MPRDERMERFGTPFRKRTNSTGFRTRNKNAKETPKRKETFYDGLLKELSKFSGMEDAFQSTTSGEYEETPDEGWSTVTETESSGPDDVFEPPKAKKCSDEITDTTSSSSEEVISTDVQDAISSSPGKAGYKDVQDAILYLLENVEFTDPISSISSTSGKVGCTDVLYPHSTEKLRATGPPEVRSFVPISITNRSDIQDSEQSICEERCSSSFKKPECNLLNADIYVSPKRSQCAGFNGGETPYNVNLFKKVRPVSLFPRFVNMPSATSLQCRDSHRNESQNSVPKSRNESIVSVFPRDTVIPSPIHSHECSEKIINEWPKLAGNVGRSKSEEKMSNETENKEETSTSELSDQFSLPEHESSEATSNSSATTENFSMKLKKKRKIIDPKLSLVPRDSLNVSPVHSREFNRISIRNFIKSKNDYLPASNIKKSLMMKRKKTATKYKRIVVFSDSSSCDDSSVKSTSLNIRRKKAQSKSGAKARKVVDDECNHSGDKSYHSDDESNHSSEYQKIFQIPNNPEDIQREIDEYKEHLKTLTICPISLSRLPLLKYEIRFLK